MRPKSPWTHAHVKLKRLYDQRVPEGMTQADFGRIYDIGNQSMVAQYLNGTRPLNYDVAAKFARALKCKIEDFCPEMANTLSLEIFPYLGKSLRRVTMLVLALQLGGIPPDANANQGNFLHKNTSYYTFSDFLRWLFRRANCLFFNNALV